MNGHPRFQSPKYEDCSCIDEDERITAAMDVIKQVTAFQRDMEEDEKEEDVDDSTLDSAKDLDDEDDDEEEEDAVQMGFRFCAEEAIRFLTEEEHFSPTDPIILELRKHLHQKEMQLLHKQPEQKEDVTEGAAATAASPESNSQTVVADYDSTEIVKVSEHQPPPEVGTK